jgi:serine/threonine protein kinase
LISVTEVACAGSSDGFKGALAWDARLRIARGAAEGIAHIHECGPRKYIHGDIKPANILLDAFLEARIADFGLQRLLSLSESERVRELGSARGDTGRASSVSPAPG